MTDSKNQNSRYEAYVEHFLWYNALMAAVEEIAFEVLMRLSGCKYAYREYIRAGVVQSMQWRKIEVFSTETVNDPYTHKPYSRPTSKYISTEVENFVNTVVDRIIEAGKKLRA